MHALDALQCRRSDFDLSNSLLAQAPPEYFICSNSRFSILNALCSDQSKTAMRLRQHSWA